MSEHPGSDPALLRPARGARPAAALTLAALGIDTLAALLTALIALSYAAGYGAMIFSAGLSPWLPAGMPTALLSCVLVALVVSLTSSVPFVIAGPDSNATALLAPLAAGIALSVHAAGGDDEAVLATVLMLIAVSSLATGALLFALAHWKRGNAIQYIPFPVIGGFLAGTGLLLLEGALRVLTDMPVGLATPRIVMQLPWLASVPALVVGLGLLVLTRITRPSRYAIVLPSMMALGIALFYVGLAASGKHLEDARRMGLLFRYEPLSGMRLPVALIHVAWLPMLWSRALDIVAIAAVSSMTVLLNATSIGVTTSRDIDFNREMRAAGLANLLTGLAGGLVGAQSMTRTMTNWRLGVRDRRAGVLAALLSLAVIAFFPSMMTLLPKPVLVGLQLFIGAAMLIEWLVMSVRRLPWHDYLLIPAIMVCIAVYGIAAGVLLGIVAACLLFVVRYGRVNCLRREFDGRGRRSNVERGVDDTRLLDAHAHTLYGVALQGFLFFGTAHSILAHIRGRIEAPEGTSKEPGVRFVLVDFARVHGVDASSAASFVRLRQACGRVRAQIVLTGLSPALRSWLARDATHANDSNGPGSLHVFDDLDGGLEWIETQILRGARGAASARATPAGSDAFVSTLPATLDALRPHLDTLRLAPGDYLFRQADPGDSIYFVETGRVTVALALGDGHTLRLRSFGAGTIVGEMAVYTGAQRSADVVADEPTVVSRLALATLRRLEDEDPALAARMHKFAARVLAARLGAANEQLRAAQ
ncbi:SulP family inorganic anion transporter [Caballeronia sp. LZ034LL]|uniref:SLC26A/SulP transporter family protein n=1 Tax=Caballeronia sp. LZ034LL TaxID=3038567 RepID=UPI002854CF6D|nr:SulP family inorganic anion transporter [Caballeronia sp. LZ034LL]MDR5833987.1 SulP family inorganic anion transporter [Caballeronia sp. LZ034LL]